MRFSGKNGNRPAGTIGKQNADSGKNGNCHEPARHRRHSEVTAGAAGSAPTAGIVTAIKNT